MDFDNAVFLSDDDMDVTHTISIGGDVDSNSGVGEPVETVEEGRINVVIGGTITDDYTIVQPGQMGEGVYAQVVAARNNATGKTVAIKVTMANKDFVPSAEQELEHLKHMRQQLNGRNPLRRYLVELTSDFAYGDHICLVFPILGPNLYDAMAKRDFYPFDLKETSLIGYQLTSALAFMHSCSLVHTDVKLENVMLVDNSSEERKDVLGKPYLHYDRLDIKLGDFNTTLTFEKCHAHRDTIQTKNYRAPEVILGIHPWTSMVDVFSLGCCLYELACGRYLFSPVEPDDESVQQKPKKKRRGSVDDFQESTDHMRAIQRHFPVDQDVFNMTDVDVTIDDIDRKLNKREIRNREVMDITEDNLEELAGKHGLHGMLLMDLLRETLATDPAYRMTAAEARRHDFFLKHHPADDAEARVLKVPLDTTWKEPKRAKSIRPAPMAAGRKKKRAPVVDIDD